MLEICRKRPLKVQWPIMQIILFFLYDGVLLVLYDRSLCSFLHGSRVPFYAYDYSVEMLVFPSINTSLRIILNIDILVNYKETTTLLSSCYPKNIFPFFSPIFLYSCLWITHFDTFRTFPHTYLQNIHIYSIVDIRTTQHFVFCG